MNTLVTTLEIEGALLGVAIICLAIAEVSEKHPNAFKLPALRFSKPAPTTPSSDTSVAPSEPRNTFFHKLARDIKLIWKPQEPEFFTSPDGNTLYLSAKLTNDWKPEQVVLFMLSHKQEFLDQIHAKDPAVFDAVNTLVTQLSSAKINVAFRKMNILPSFSKSMVVWKLPLLSLSSQSTEDIVVKESTV